jgi:type II secretory pathway component PulK
MVGCRNKQIRARAGMSLPLTLAALALAAGLALLLQARSVGRTGTAEAALAHERLRLAAAEAARGALAVLAADGDLAVDSLDEDWAQPMEWSLEDGIAAWARIEDAGRFFCWNNLAASNAPGRAQRDILMDLLTCCGDFTPVVRAEALADFTDADGNGAYEASFYAAEDPPSAPADRPLWAPAELFRVHGFSGELFRAVGKEGRRTEAFSGDLAASTALVPTGPGEGIIPVNVNTAGREVLTGVSGLQHESAVRAVLALRQERPFRSLATVFAAHPEWAAELEGVVGTASSFFRVRAEASLEGAGTATATAWVKRSENGDLEILQWIWNL